MSGTMCKEHGYTHNGLCPKCEEKSFMGQRLAKLVVVGPGTFKPVVTDSSRAAGLLQAECERLSSRVAELEAAIKRHKKQVQETVFAADQNLWWHVLTAAERGE